MIDAALRSLVARRAGYCCEYCRLPEQVVPATFHIDHIIPVQHGGSDALDNLCHACSRCNLHRGPNLSGIDPDTGQIVVLFNPCRQAWSDHSEWQGAVIVGRTPVGRATAAVLQMNAPRRVRLRARLSSLGLLP